MTNSFRIQHAILISFIAVRPRRLSLGIAGKAEVACRNLGLGLPNSHCVQFESAGQAVEFHRNLRLWNCSCGFVGNAVDGNVFNLIQAAYSFGRPTANDLFSLTEIADCILEPTILGKLTFFSTSITDRYLVLLGIYRCRFVWQFPGSTHLVQ